MLAVGVAVAEEISNWQTESGLIHPVTRARARRMSSSSNFALLFVFLFNLVRRLQVKLRCAFLIKSILGTRQ